MWHPERRELWVEHQGKILNLFDYDNKKFDWHGDLDLSFLDLKTDEIPDLSKMTVHGDLNVSHNELSGFQSYRELFMVLCMSVLIAFLHLMVFRIWLPVNVLCLGILTKEQNVLGMVLWGVLML